MDGGEPGLFGGDEGFALGVAGCVGGDEDGEEVEVEEGCGLGEG